MVDLEDPVARGRRRDDVFETARDSDGGYAGPARLFGAVAGITRWRWPTDQRTAGGVLHAKLV